MFLSFLKKNGLTIAIFSFLLMLLFVPDAKALVWRGLMKVGLFSPKIEPVKDTKADLSGIVFRDRKGLLVNLGELKGKVIFINFWATWCPPCRAEMPGLNRLYNKFKNDKNVVFIFADAGGDLLKSTKFLARKNYNLPLYKIETTMPSSIFERTLPTTVIFDKQGRLSFHHEGLADYADKKIEDFIEKLRDI